MGLKLVFKYHVSTQLQPALEPNISRHKLASMGGIQNVTPSKDLEMQRLQTRKVKESSSIIGWSCSLLLQHFLRLN